MIEKATEQVLVDRRRVAAGVRDELTAAGLPVPGDIGVRFRAGAVVEISETADADGGVWVSWDPHPHLSHEAATAVSEGRLDDPVIERSGTVAEIMGTALAEILRAAGFEVEDPDEEYRPYAIRVISGASGG